MSDKLILGSYLGACAIITWRDFTHPNADWPLPAPPPYRYLWATVGFGLCYLVSMVTSPKVGATLAVGLMFGLAFQTAATYKKGPGPNLGKPNSTPSSPSNLGGTPGQAPFNGTIRA